MGLSDLSGAYLCRALRNNRSIVKVDAEGNNFGPKTLTSLADSLTTNDVVRHVNLEGNPLVKNEAGGHDVAGVGRLAEMLKVNNSLRYLNLFGCNIQSSGGHQLVSGLVGNAALIFLEVGNNGLSQGQTRRVADRLDENKDRYERVKMGEIESARQVREGR